MRVGPLKSRRVFLGLMTAAIGSFPASFGCAPAGPNSAGAPALAMVLSRNAGARRAITAVGAVGDGVTLNTIAIQKTIDELAASGGGTMVIPAGKFLSGAIFLKPGVNLHLDKDAVLLGSTNINDYPSLPTRIEGHTEVWRPALVNADKCDGLRITGEGTIQGGGKPFWDAFWDRRKAEPKVTNLAVERPRNVFIRDSSDVILSGISLRESGFWNLHVYRCRNLTIEKLDIRTPPRSPSTDGIDVDSCQDVTIRGCYIAVDDDNIALKGSKGPLADQDKDSPAVERIRIVDCTFAHGHGAITLGSEACHVKDVLVENCTMEDGEYAAASQFKNTLLRIKLRPDTPQRYENIHLRNIKVNSLGRLISVEPWTQFFDLKGQPEPAQLVDNITLENVTGSLANFGTIAGPKRAVIQNIMLKDVDLKVKNPRVTIRGVEGLKIENAKMNGETIAPTSSETRPTTGRASG